MSFYEEGETSFQPHSVGVLYVGIGLVLTCSRDALALVHAHSSLSFVPRFATAASLDLKASRVKRSEKSVDV